LKGEEENGRLARMALVAIEKYAIKKSDLLCAAKIFEPKLPEKFKKKRRNKDDKIC
jgi:hypothetical protein